MIDIEKMLETKIEERGRTMYSSIQRLNSLLH